MKSFVIYCLISCVSLFAQVDPLRQKAVEGDTEAQVNLATNYAYGLGVAQNGKEAVKWFRLAADKGNARAQMGLGLCYAQGRGVETDEREAFKWFSRAASQNYPLAQLTIATYYAQGKGGVKIDQVKATEWCLLAAQQGLVQAQMALAERYVNGEGIEKNEIQAIEWYKKAAEQGNTDANNKLKSLKTANTPINIDKSTFKISSNQILFCLKYLEIYTSDRDKIGSFKKLCNLLDIKIHSESQQMITAVVDNWIVGIGKSSENWELIILRQQPYPQYEQDSLGIGEQIDHYEQMSLLKTLQRIDKENGMYYLYFDINGIQGRYEKVAQGNAVRLLLDR